ncbi:MAG: ribbon-helix-helix domain-containing protein [Spirochaetaceae bacterium]|jgi:hypothetical protein|nr:ribbon-helix-helix domain-containing protein [Spirochaetaceae bacterium]
MTTARLSEEIEQRLDAAARARGVSKTLLVKDALVKYLDMEIAEQSSWDIGECYFGNYGSGDGNLSVDYKNRFRDKVRAKHRAH